MPDKETLIANISANLGNLTASELEHLKHEMDGFQSSKAKRQEAIEKSLSMIGAWADWPQEEFDAFLNDIAERRKNWYTTRERFEP